MGKKHLFTLGSLLALAAVVVGYQKGVPKSPKEDKAVADRPPAARDRVAGDEGRRVLPGVALHVAVHVAAVPGRRLRLDDGARG
ncbi:MAG TPA: hypothetical protein VF570_17025, partial [Pyrinomonadaceae bacterium]